MHADQALTNAVAHVILMGNTLVLFANFSQYQTKQEIELPSLEYREDDHRRCLLLRS